MAPRRLVSPTAAASLLSNPTHNTPQSPSQSKSPTETCWPTQHRRNFTRPAAKHAAVTTLPAHATRAAPHVETCTASGETCTAQASTAEGDASACIWATRSPFTRAAEPDTHSGAGCARCPQACGPASLRYRRPHQADRRSNRVIRRPKIKSAGLQQQSAPCHSPSRQHPPEVSRCSSSSSSKRYSCRRQQQHSPQTSTWPGYVQAQHGVHVHDVHAHGVTWAGRTATKVARQQTTTIVADNNNNNNTHGRGVSRRAAVVRSNLRLGSGDASIVTTRSPDCFRSNSR
jgi:hypothetical protein